MHPIEGSAPKKKVREIFGKPKDYEGTNK